MLGNSASEPHVQTLVSVVMPVYNGQRYLEESLHSILRQSDEQLEFIAIDDRSTDSSLQILEALARQDPRVCVLSTEANSGGPARPKNIGIAAARGEFVCFQDQDDVAMPDKVTVLRSALLATLQFDAVFGDFQIIDSNGAAAANRYLLERQFLDLAKKYLTALEADLFDCGDRYFGCMAASIIGISTQGVMCRSSDRI